MTPPRVWRSVVSSGLDFPILAALSLILVHAATNGQYGFHRDELATLDDARHLAWGYVAYPPAAPFIARVALLLFGPSMVGVRFFATLAVGVALALTGLMVKDLGGKRRAQALAAAAAAIAPITLAEGTVFQYVAIDYLWWVLAAWFTVRLLQSGNPRWWMGIGAAIGLGMMTKYTIVFLVAGIAGGVLFTPARRHLRSRWLWCGVALALLIFLPNLIWQIRHGFISLDFLRHIHERDIRIGRADGFVTHQIVTCVNLFAAPLYLAGLYYFLAAPAGKRLRPIGWMYVIPFALFVAAKGRDYYLAPAYPMLLAAGAVLAERWIASLTAGWARLVQAAAWTALAAGGLIVAAVILPVAPVDSPWWRTVNKGYDMWREEIGWPELVGKIAAIRDSLPAEERSRVGIFAGNYGEAGAIALYGPAHGLPAAISGVNSHWLRGYGDAPSQTLIVVGFSQEFVSRNFESCVLAGRNANRYEVENEESKDHPDIFVCRRLRQPWPEFWKSLRSYG